MQVPHFSKYLTYAVTGSTLQAILKALDSVEDRELKEEALAEVSRANHYTVEEYVNAM